jgi:transketolase
MGTIETPPAAAPAARRTAETLDDVCVNTIRTLAIDAVQQANSGHPGTPMALAPVVYCLWQRFLRFDPNHPIWPNRDRFVLSVGHASTLLYAVLHLTGVKAVNSRYETLGRPSVTVDDIKRFRQLDSRCPGHPEYRWTSGVETTTGPLGQGLATSVGMAIAERWLASYFNRPGFDLFDYDIYALCGDGCMMEGLSSEAASLAGHLRLSNLCWIYDNNHITIEGNTALAYSDDVATRFIGYGWNVTRVGDANDLEMLDRAFRTFKRTGDRPTLIIVDSHIAYGAPNKQDTSAAHGEPLGEEEVRLAKRHYGWPEDAEFLVPEGVYEHFHAGIGGRGRRLHRAWWATFDEYQQRYPELSDHGHRLLRRQLPDQWDEGLPTFPAGTSLATRDASSRALNALAANVPWLLGGSADLGPSCKTRLTSDGAGDFSADTPAGRNLHFGIREHAMAAILNGLSLSKVRPFGSGFLIFSDYGRAAIRLSALMELPVIHIFTHDSIGVGEDGPTHQPVEHLASLRAIPGLITLRPADANETVEAWRVDPDAPGRADARSDDIRRGGRRTARRLRARGSGRRRPRRAAARHRQRSLALPRGVRSAHGGGHQGPRRELAVVGAVRAVLPRASGISRPGAARVRDRARLGGEGVDAGVGSIRRPRRMQHRHGHVRGVGAAQGAAEEVRLHAREHRRRGEAADCRRGAAIVRHPMSTSERSDSAGVVSLADEGAVKQVLVSSILGLWDVVNELTRLRPSRSDRYRVTIFGSARSRPGTFGYEETRRTAAALAAMGCDIITGGGPGLMQAANEGADSAGTHARSVGIRVDLPFEQDANAFVTQAFEHRTFFTRLHQFVLTSDAFVVAPGGIGTLLEAVLIWQLLQVKHLQDTPLILVGRMWPGLIEWARSAMLDTDAPLAGPDDIGIPRCVATADEAIAILRERHEAWRRQMMEPIAPAR